MIKKNVVNLKSIFRLPPESLSIVNAIGGHMAYDHLLIDTINDKFFAKVHNPNKFTDPKREKHAIYYLKKEQLYLKHLREKNYVNVPDRSDLVKNTKLIMDAYKTEDDWQWRAPNDQEEKLRYIKEILEALSKLNQIDVPSLNYHKHINPTYDTLWAEGWDCVDDDKICKIKNKISSIVHNNNDYHYIDTVRLLNDLDIIRKKAFNIKRPKNLVLCHNDARQSNIAWHHEKGVKIVDWSWADLSPRKADSTMFLIDLSKSGHNISDYIDSYFDNEHAVVMIGFWLAHSLHESRDDSDTVRTQQIASAVAAYRLIRASLQQELNLR
ncbi:MAG: phosphotransferase [Candidatus Saccharibacteria bacterium]